MEKTQNIHDIYSNKKFERDKNKPKKLLSIGCGKDWELFSESVENKFDEIILVDNQIFPAMSFPDNITFCSQDIFSFLSDYPNQDITHIYASRVMEHIKYDQIHYLLYLLNTIARQGAILEIIVPDFLKVSKKLHILNYSKQTADAFNLDLIQTHTEIFNCIKDPHQSIWTLELAKYYICLEGYWEYHTEPTHIQLDWRDWYLHIIATRR